MGQMNYVKCKIVRSYTAVIKKKKLYKVKTDPGVANTRGKKACDLRPSKLGARAGVWGSGGPVSQAPCAETAWFLRRCPNRDAMRQKRP